MMLGIAQPVTPARIGTVQPLHFTSTHVNVNEAIPELPQFYQGVAAAASKQAENSSQLQGIYALCKYL